MAFNSPYRRHICFRSGFAYRGALPARATSFFGGISTSAMGIIAGASSQTLNYRVDRTCPWQPLTGAFLHPGPAIPIIDDTSHRVIMAPQNATLFVPFSSAVLRPGPMGGQVQDNDGLIWQSTGASYLVAFARYVMLRAGTVDAGQVSGRV
jgi:hypothetical protein